MTNRFQQAVNRKLDLLVAVDDSPGMRSLQSKLARQLPALIQVLFGRPGGLSDLHVAVVSTSLGAGKFLNVPGCSPESGGDNAGKFVHPQACAALSSGHSFIIANGTIANFTGDIADLFACMGNVGSGGCVFSQPLAAVRRALEKAANPLDPDNGGFLRPDAYLAILILTNQDDCSVPPDSDLFDPGQMSLADPYGGLHPYRCAEFGHRCSGAKPPHDLPAGVDRLALENCVAAGPPSPLSPVSDFVDFLFTLKPGSPEQIFVSAAAGLPGPYVIERTRTPVSGDVTEPQPVLLPSCMGSEGDHGSPSPRLKAWLDGFGSNAILESICTDNLGTLLIPFAGPVYRTLGPQCISGAIARRADGSADCQVVSRSSRSNGGAIIEQELPICDAHQANYPCWKLSSDRFGACAGGQIFQVCNDPVCLGERTLSGSADVTVTCALLPPC